MSINKAMLLLEFHCYEPTAGLASLWLYKDWNPNWDWEPEPYDERSDDPNAIRLAGPTTAEVCEAVAKGVEIALSHFSVSVERKATADD